MSNGDLTGHSSFTFTSDQINDRILRSFTRHCNVTVKKEINIEFLFVMFSARSLSSLFFSASSRSHWSLTTLVFDWLCARLFAMFRLAIMKLFSRRYLIWTTSNLVLISYPVNCKCNEISISYISELYRDTEIFTIV